MKIVGVGLNRTGTTTLGVALQRLGYRHTSMHREALGLYLKRDTVSLLRLMEGYDSFEDWPWPLCFREIDRAYPDSRFILTTRRSAEVWYQSLCRLAQITGPTEVRRAVYGHAMPQGHRDELVAFYHAHNRAVEDWFRDRPERLLKVCWEDGAGWAELCTFLGRQVPDEPFPRVNQSARHPRFRAL